MRWINHLVSLFRRSRMEQGLDEELRYHIEEKTQTLIAAGTPPEEARQQALRAFGRVSAVKESTRETWGYAWLETLRQDLQFGLRTLRRNPGFAAVAVITLALGIGANTAIFSVVNTVLLRPLPYKDPGSLVWAAIRFPSFHGGAFVNSPDFAAWRDHNQVLQQIGAFGGSKANLTGAGEPARVSLRDVTVGFFGMLGVDPILGRTFTADEGKEGQNHVALLSESLWRTRFGASRKVLGKTIHLDNDSYTVVGVMPGSLSYPDADVWTPIALNAAEFSPHSKRWEMLTVIGRLKPGITISQAQSDLLLVTHQIDREYGPQAVPYRAHEQVEVIPLHALLVRNVRSLLLILLGAVGFVLLIACANVANLLLSRAAARGKEMAVRSALGAGRARLIRQLLTESVMLAVAGGLFGLLAGLWSVQLLKRLIPPNLPSEIRLDPRVFGFVIGIAVLAVVLFGLVPAIIASRPDVSEALKEGGIRAGVSHGTHRLRSLLVISEIALSLILLIGAGLLARSFVRLTNVDLGFDPHHLLSAAVWRPMTQGFNTPSPAPFFHDVLEKLRALPGVERTAATTHPPVSIFNELMLGFNVQGAEAVHPAQPVSLASVSPDYFRTMGIHLLKGRFFDEHDGNGAPNVVILDETLAREAFKNRDPLGQRIGGGPNGPWRTVVGVVADTRNYELNKQPWPELYAPYFQEPRRFMTFVLRVNGNPLSVASAVRKVVQSVDKNQPVSNIQTMDEVIAKSAAPQRFRMLLLGLFAVLALALAGVGIYGVMSYSVSQRTHEIGVRMALGAQRQDVLRLVVWRGMALAIAGILIGLGGAFALTRFLASMLYGIGAVDPLTFTALSLLLAAVALFACYIPARRATKVDPVIALRCE